MRAALTRPLLLVLVLVLAVLATAGLGALMACHTSSTVRQVTSVATVDPTTQPAQSCPGCALGDVRGMATAAAIPVAAGSSPGGISPVASQPLSDGCTSDHPCQHNRSNERGAEVVSVRAPDTARHAGPAVLPRCVLPHRPWPVRQSSMASPVPPPAVLAPVAVLCVDRN